MTMVRASALHGYRELTSELGSDPREALRRFRIPASALDEPQAFVSYRALIRLLEHTAEATGCEDFGLQLSQRQDLGILGALGVAVRNCETLGEAIQCATRYMFVHSSAISFSSSTGSDPAQVVFEFRILLENTGPTVQVTELSLGLAARMITMLAQKTGVVSGVRFGHAHGAPIAAYWAHFESPVQFNCKISAVEIAASDLRLPIHDASQALRDLAEGYLELHHGDAKTPLSARVRRVVQRSLGTGVSSCVDVASVFAVHPRTLQRHLNREGTTFERLKDQARAELARTYIANAELPLTQVAALLDYSEQSALTRSCRRWFGRSPRTLRREIVDADHDAIAKL